MSIINTIKTEIDDFIYNDIEVVDGYLFNQYDTIKRAHLYLNSQFEDNSLYHGREKIFFNISTPRKDAVVRFLDVDTKDIRLYEVDPKSEVASMLLQKELEIFMKENKVGKILNQLADEIATYGSVVLKKTKKGVEIVDLRRLFLDPTVEELEDSRFITIKHYMTAHELRETGRKNGWDMDNVELIIRKKEELRSQAPQSYEREGQLNQVVSARLIEVYERYGFLPRNEVEGKGTDESEIKSLCIVAEPHLMSTDKDGVEHEEGVILFKEKWNKDYPFTDFHFYKTRGRWLGIGVMEAMFPAQERINELANQKRISMEVSTMHLFQTSDPTVFNNILSDVVNGQILRRKPNSEGIVPVANEERNLNAFTSEEQNYTNLADNVSHAGEFIRGDEVPTSTPATNAVITSNNNTSIHLFRRENFCAFLREFFVDHVLPELLKNISEEHILRFVGSPDELARLDDLITKWALTKEVKERALGMEIIDAGVLEGLEREIRISLKKKGNKRFVRALKDYYKDKEVELDIIVDNEQENVAVVANNTFSFMQLAAQPGLLDDPVLKELAFSYGRRIGVPTEKLELADAERQSMKAQQEQMMQQQMMMPQQNTAMPLQADPMIR